MHGHLGGHRGEEASKSGHCLCKDEGNVGTYPPRVRTPGKDCKTLLYAGPENGRIHMSTREKMLLLMVTCAFSMTSREAWVVPGPI